MDLHISRGHSAQGGQRAAEPWKLEFQVTASWLETEPRASVKSGQQSYLLDCLSRSQGLEAFYMRLPDNINYN